MDNSIDDAILCHNGKHNSAHKEIVLKGTEGLQTLFHLILTGLMWQMPLQPSSYR